MQFADNQIEYVAWENHAYRFYIGARLLYLNKVLSPAAFCAQQALELILKATLLYWDKGFNPKSIGHRGTSLLRATRNKVLRARSLTIEPYFFAGQRYQSHTRYPQGGILIPGKFLDDLDEAFYSTLSLVPFQFNSQLVNTLRRETKPELLILRRRNKRMRSLRTFLAPWVRFRGSRTEFPASLRDLIGNA